MLRLVRQFATKRTIPYVTKNNWVLPEMPTTEAQSSPEKEVNDQSWGTLKVLKDGEKPINVPKGWRRLKTLPQWKKQMFALKEKFPEGWSPKKKLSREEMAKLRELKIAQPNLSLNMLADMFKISPEAVRRVVKSRWRPDEKEANKLNERWVRRGIKLGSKNLQTKPRRPPAHSRGRKMHDPAQEIF